MTPEEFRAAGHQLIDWIADYRTNLEQAPVRSVVSPGDVRSAFDPTPPTETLAFETLLERMDQVVVPGVLQVQHPMHFGWFPSNATLSSVLGDIASSGLGTLGLSWESCPSLTEVEEVVVDWLRQLCGMSDQWTGAIQDTASTATVTAAFAARERATGLSQNSGGLQSEPRPLCFYTTAQAHSSVAKAALLAGIGWENIAMVRTDPVTFAMDPADLRSKINADLRAGKLPAMIVACAGSTGVTAFDPIDEVADVAASFAGKTGVDEAIWLHVDAAMAGSAMMLEEMRPLFVGAERADSLTWNPHKWMGAILDCSLLYVRNSTELTSVMATNPSYLQSAADGAVTQYRDWGIPLGRRFRALKVWFQLELDGVDTIKARLRRDLANAKWFADQVDAAEDWELVAPLTLQTVCVRHRPPGLTGDALDAHTLGWLEAINSSGAAFCTGGQLSDGWMVRVSVGVETTESRHIEALWQLFQDSVKP